MIKAGAIIVRDSRFCIVRKKGTDKFIIPGGRIEKGETDLEALRRELLEELKVSLISAKRFGKFNGLSAFEGVPLEIRVYQVEINGEPEPDSEIAELAWIGRDYTEPVGAMLVPIILAMIEANII